MRKYLRKLKPYYTHAMYRWRQCRHKETTTPTCEPTGQLPLLVEGKPCIWLAWTGSNPIPGYLQLCYESIRKHNESSFSIILLTPENIHEYLKDIHPAYPYLSYVHRADYLRCEILHQRGGIYLDMDTICFKDLSRWYEKIHAYDIVNYDGTPWNEVLGISIFGPTRRNSIFTREWSRRLRQHLDIKLPQLMRFREANDDPKTDCLGWAEILSGLVQPLARELDQQKKLSLFKIGLSYIQAAAEQYTTQNLLADNPLRVSDDAYLLILSNELYPASLKALSREQILISRTGLAFLLRQAL